MKRNFTQGLGENTQVRPLKTNKKPQIVHQAGAKEVPVEREEDVGWTQLMEDQGQGKQVDM